MGRKVGVGERKGERDGKRIEEKGGKGEEGRRIREVEFPTSSTLL